jgi:hypothetical protein
MSTFKTRLSAFVKLVTAFSAAALVASCGGGGVSADGNAGVVAGPLSLNPSAGNFYANVPVTLTIAGGTRPYLLSTTEPTILPGINGATTRENRVTLLPAQPGVVDPETDPNVVPARSLSISVRDTTGTTITSTYKILVNYILGYGTTISNLNPGLAEQQCGSATNVCAGQEAAVFVRPTSAGISRPGRAIKLDVIQGDYDFVSNDTAGTLTKTATFTSNVDGEIGTKIRARAGAPTQIAIMRITDVQTNATRDEIFTIASANSGTDIITAIPTEITFTGPTTANCAASTADRRFAADIYLFGGKPPYTILNTAPDAFNIEGGPVLTNGGRFSIVPTGRVCSSTGISIIVRDATGRQISVTATNEVGSSEPPPEFTVTPPALTFVGCSSATTTIIGAASLPYITISEASFSASQPVPIAGFPGFYSVTITRSANCSSSQTSPVNPAGQQCTTATGVATFIGRGGTRQTVALTGSCPTSGTGTGTTTASITVPPTPVNINQCGTVPVTFLASGLTTSPIVTLSPALTTAGFTVTQPTNGAGAGQLVFNISRNTNCSFAASQCVAATGAAIITADAGATGSPASLTVNGTCNP